MRSAPETVEPLRLPAGKRLMDLLGAVAGLLLLWPIFLLAVLVIAPSPGPLLFRQERIGLGARPFTIFKFRTMSVGAQAGGTGAVTVRGDPRLIRGAQFLRRFKIDEMPQIFNVLNGTMSLVGPRPTVQEDFERMSETQRQRFAVPPGLTGLAQISGNTALSWPQRIEHDLAYIGRLGVWFDLSIILRTVALIVSARIETHPAHDDEWSQ